MSFIEVPRPPGVFSWITSAAACSLLARSIESLTNDADTGLISRRERDCDHQWPAPPVAAPGGNRADREQRREASRSRLQSASHTPNGTSRRRSPCGNSADRDGGHLGRAVRHARHHQPAVVDRRRRRAPSAPPARVTCGRAARRARARRTRRARTRRSAARGPQQVGQELGPVDRGAGLDAAAMSPAPARRAAAGRARGSRSARRRPRACRHDAPPARRTACGRRHDVVRPAHLRVKPDGVADSVGDHQRERRQPLGRGVRLERQREHHPGAVGAFPRPSQAAAPGGLQLACDHATVRQRPGRLLGGCGTVSWYT